MTLTEQLEQDRERLLADLEGAGDPVRVQAVMGAELDRLLFRYNEQCQDEREREAASGMMQTARMALALTDSAGEVKIWENARAAQRTSGWRILLGLPLVLLAAACACAVLALVTLGNNPESTLPNLVSAAVLLAAASAAAFFAGWLAQNPERSLRKKAGRGKETSRRTEILTDPQKLYRCLHNILLTIDRNLADIRSAEGWKKREQAGQASQIEGRTLELCLSLLEAACSGDGNYALERMEDVRYFLHEKGIETVMYSKEHADWFDMLPGSRTGTVRPALTEEGVLLKKGLAVGGK